ncbi:MAG: hypothetical protein ABS76_35615 [Pelagibacterium sp. SCN 64-44]|nr:MAG: hypothetical protein ABS76_35615 [Pelagibacterium sp. SCN 64-44]
MLRSKLKLLLALMFVLTSMMLAAPVMASAAHTLDVMTVASTMDDHGHSHAEEHSNAHDSIDHVHDVPHFARELTIALMQPAQSWPSSPFSRGHLGTFESLDRPPRHMP